MTFHDQLYSLQIEFIKSKYELEINYINAQYDIQKKYNKKEISEELEKEISEELEKEISKEPEKEISKEPEKEISNELNELKEIIQDYNRQFIMQNISIKDIQAKCRNIQEKYNIEKNLAFVLKNDLDKYIYKFNNQLIISSKFEKKYYEIRDELFLLKQELDKDIFQKNMKEELEYANELCNNHIKKELSYISDFRLIVKEMYKFKSENDNLNSELENYRDIKYYNNDFDYEDSQTHNQLIVSIVNKY